MIRPNVNLAEELEDDIKSTIASIAIRHEGKEVFSDLIQSFKEGFDSMKWKNVEEARKLVNDGMNMIKKGADEDELRSQCRRIYDQMTRDSDGQNGTSVGT